MNGLTDYIWIIPVLPLAAATILALMPAGQRRLAQTLGIASIAISFVIAAMLFIESLSEPLHEEWRFTAKVTWITLGDGAIELGWLWDPMTALMAVMVCLVSTLVFIYSAGYMARDPNIVRFYCFLSLFASAMLGLVISNSLLLLFMCWELVGLASYLLIGFWYARPAAAAAAKKAFLTTRIGDMGLLLGMLWLYRETGTLLFYDGGNGCLESAALNDLAVRYTLLGLPLAFAISVLIFIGAAGKSGQVPLHVWLPDAMEGPTPVSALIHAATMVAAGVFLMARVYPLIDVDPQSILGRSGALTVVTWAGAVTAVVGALMACAQSDIKRILAYSTVSQLGYMMMGLGVGGPAVAFFHLITHAFFKALLFLGAGSVIHGCHGEQDIRSMGGLRRWMPVTFVVYAIGMLALAGLPLFFSGFWSKDGILHAAHGWDLSQWPFYLGLFGTFLTAYYMTRQMRFVFFGERRQEADNNRVPHESPVSMLAPMVVLAVFAITAGFFGTPAWPWLQQYLNASQALFGFSKLFEVEFVTIAVVSGVAVAGGMLIAWVLYRGVRGRHDPDPVERLYPGMFGIFKQRLYFDEAYERTIIRFTHWLGRQVGRGDGHFARAVFGAVSAITIVTSWLCRWFDEWFVNGGFDRSCRGLIGSGRYISFFQTGRVQDYLRFSGLAILLLLWMVWALG